MNDTISLIFHFDEPDRHDIGFEEAVGVVLAVERLFGATARLLDPEQNPSHFKFRLNGAPRRGSLEFLLIPIMVQWAYPSTLDWFDRHGITIERAAATATIATFVAEVAFAPWGVLARLSDQDHAPPRDAPRECAVAAELSQAPNAEVMEAATQLLGAVAEAGCTHIDISVRSYGPVSVDGNMVLETKGIAARPSAARPDDLRLLRRVQGVSALPVSLNGDHVASLWLAPTGESVVLVFRLDEAVPGTEVAEIEVEGRWVDRAENIHSRKGPITGAYQAATGAFAVSRWRDRTWRE